MIGGGVLVIYVGDIHGRLDAVREIDRLADRMKVSAVINVGDSGLMFGGYDCPVKSYFDNRESGPIWISCGGNHENYSIWYDIASDVSDGEAVELAKDFFWARRGDKHEIGGLIHLFIGGAESSDKSLRIDGLSWWKEETPTDDEFNKFRRELNKGGIDVVVSHDAPLRVPLMREGRETSTTPVSLEEILKSSRSNPPLWVFGHHHITEVFDVDGTRFVCCGLHGEGWSQDEERFIGFRVC